MLKNTLRRLDPTAFLQITHRSSETDTSGNDVAGPSRWKDQVIHCDDPALRARVNVLPRSYGSQPERLLPLLDNRALLHPFTEPDPKGKQPVRTLYTAGPLELSHTHGGYLALRAPMSQRRGDRETFYLREASPELFDGRILTLTYKQMRRALDEEEREAFESQARWHPGLPAVIRYAEAVRQSIAETPRYDATEAQAALAMCPPELAKQASRTGDAPLAKEKQEAVILAMYRGPQLVTVSRRIGTRWSRALKPESARLRVYTKALGEPWQGPWRADGATSSSGWAYVRTKLPASPDVAELTAPITLRCNPFEADYRINDDRAICHHTSTAE